MPQDKPKAVSAEYNSKGQYIGAKVVDRVDKVVEAKADSEDEKQEKNELENAKEWDRPSILKMQAARRAAKAAKASASPSPSPEETPKAVSAALAKASPTPKK